MPALAMSPVISGTSSGTPSDEDFVSGSSADDQSYIDRLTVDISAFGLGSGVTNGFTLFGAPQRQKQSQQHQSVEQQKCSSDSGLSSSEFEHANDMLNSEFP
ncbi:unnamed protein product [Enterobius vermicularis]|uniref:Uncharacterized protein n=1 Tax=Enterobius vermicularis TaxID=51028 RepID=A0A0N4VHN0_ENTVE|nr:unnamed protein product [Enterobius vermicularis]